MDINDINTICANLQFDESLIKRVRCGVAKTEDWKQKLRVPRPHSAEHCAKLSAAAKLRKGHTTKKAKACTVDGVQIFRSTNELIAALGQGSKGYRHPNFRYVA